MNPSWWRTHRFRAQQHHHHHAVGADFKLSEPKKVESRSSSTRARSACNVDSDAHQLCINHTGGCTARAKRERERERDTQRWRVFGGILKLFCPALPVKMVVRKIVALRRFGTSCMRAVINVLGKSLRTYLWNRVQAVCSQFNRFTQ